MASRLHAVLKKKGLAVFVDVRQMLRGIRERLPLAVARRRAEYVLIDHNRVPLDIEVQEFVRLHVARLHHTRDGLGYTKWSEIPRNVAMEDDRQPAGHEAIVRLAPGLPEWQARP